MKLFDKIQFNSAASWPALLYIWILIVCIIPNVALSITEDMNIAACAANVVLPLGIYMWLMSLTRNIGKSGCWMFIVMFFAAFQIVLLYLFGRSVIAVDMFLNLVTTNPDEVGELLGNMLPIIGLVIILYLPPLAASIIMIIKKRALSGLFIKKARRGSYCMMTAGAATAILAFMLPAGYNPLDQLYPLNIANNIYIAVERATALSSYHSTSANFSYHAASTRPPEEREIYVAVIGETSRASQWHLFGYGENTTAPLDSIDNLIGFGKTISESNTTHKSVPMLISYLDAETFEDSVYTSKGMITAFKEAGFSTAFISNQAPNHSFIDFFGLEADTTLFLNEGMMSGTHKYDMELVEIMEQMIASNPAPKQLYVLHSYGSHFSYLDRYPKGQGKFLPESPLEVTGSNNTALINAYNNSVLYTASVLESITQSLKKQNCKAAMIYASDHGEDIYDDDRKLFLHASPMPSYYQIHVPMIVWMSPLSARAYPGMITAARANCDSIVSSSASYFHTLLQLAGLTTPYYNDKLSLVSATYKPGALKYLNDHNEAIPLNKSGLQHEDYLMLQSIGINF